MSHKANDDVDTSPLTLIVEPDPEGHHLDYVGVLVDSCRSQGRPVVVLTTAVAVESTQWSVHLAAKAPEVIVHPPSAFALSDIAQAATDAAASLTILSDGDHYLLPILFRGWRGSGELSLLVMRADGQPRESPRLRQARGAAKKTLAWSAGLHPRVRVSALRSPLVRRRGPLRWAPEPVTLHCTAEHKRRLRERLDGYGDRYWIGVFGVITPRKNLPLIIQAILDQPDVGLVIAGAIDAQVAEAIAPLLAKFAAAGGHVLHLPGTLTDAEFDSAISAVDCVVVAHSNEGPSAVAFKAAALGRRLVLAGAKSLKRDAAYLREQAIWSTLDAEALNQAIRLTKSLPKPRQTVNLGTDGFLAALA
jgi:hypothetical protein